MAPISNDLMLAAALTSVVPATLAQTAVASNTPRTGVATTVTTRPAAAATSSTMYIDGTSNQRLTTDANTTLHVLFSDQSALTLGPNSELIIAKYEFDSKNKNGQILIDMTKGLLRVVGGLISKKNAALVRTSTATVGIRGGISVIAVKPDQTDATFLFGIDMTITQIAADNEGAGSGEGIEGAGDGNMELYEGSGPPGFSVSGTSINAPGVTITRSGYGASAGNNGLSNPTRITSNQLAQFSPAPAPAPAPSPSPSPATNTGLIAGLSSSRLSDNNLTNLLVNPGGGGGGGGGGAGGALGNNANPSLRTLLGSSTQPSNVS